MNLRAVIIDDEANNIDNLSILLGQYCRQVHIAATAATAAAGRDIILQYQPELVFLDIELQGENAFDLLRSLPELRFEIIFVTAYEQYGLQAIKFSAIDYLVKPIRAEELVTAVNKALEKSRQKNQNLQLENLLRLLQQKEPPRIALSTTRETRFIRTDQILYCMSSNNYTTFFLDDGEKILSSRPIYEYEELLEVHGFIRCHQSYIINRRQVKSWRKEDGGYLLMEDNASIPVSRNKREEVKRLLK